MLIRFDMALHRTLDQSKRASWILFKLKLDPFQRSFRLFGGTFFRAGIAIDKS